LTVLKCPPLGIITIEFAKILYLGSTVSFRRSVERFLVFVSKMLKVTPPRIDALINSFSNDDMTLEAMKTMLESFDFSFSVQTISDVIKIRSFFRVAMSKGHPTPLDKNYCQVQTPPLLYEFSKFTKKNKSQNQMMHVYLFREILATVQKKKL